MAAATPHEPRLGLDLRAIADFCRRHQIRRLSLFGSALRADFNAASDVDLLVEFEPDAKVSLFQLAGYEIELEKLIGRTVDLRTPPELSRYFRDDVLRSAHPLYERAA